MTVSDGAVRSHRTAPTHAVTTHPMPISPHHVINAIATPIGPNPFQPLSIRGKKIRAATGRIVPSITTPASPASARYLRPRPPLWTRRTGVSDQKIQTGKAPGQTVLLGAFLAFILIRLHHSSIS